MDSKFFLILSKKRTLFELKLLCIPREAEAFAPTPQPLPLTDAAVLKACCISAEDFTVNLSTVYLPTESYDFILPVDIMNGLVLNSVVEWSYP